MEKINIDRKITERADEFAEREYECGADERAHLSKGYYWGYKDAQKDLALTPEDIGLINKILFDLHFEGYDPYSTEAAQKRNTEALRRFNERKEGTKPPLQHKPSQSFALSPK